MSVYQPEQFQAFRPGGEFLIGVDSDGCVFDTMEIKQKECFVPATILVWGLQAVAKYAREAIEFVNLYSCWRGSNRFKALLIELDFLAGRPEAIARGYTPPDLSPIRDWTAAGGALNRETLRERAALTGQAVLKQAMAWNDLINERIAELVRGVPPFRGAREALEVMHGKADVIVVSQTPGEALEREWEEHGMRHLPAVIAGQEMGTKREHLIMAASGRYRPEHMLMVGDAIGDLVSAREAGTLFYPIVPGREEESWIRLRCEALDKFFSLEYAGSYEDKLIAEFEGILPATPPWQSS